MKNLILIPAMLILMTSCKPGGNPEIAAKAKVDILNTEQAFMEMAKKRGVREAFLFYAAPDAAILRGEKLYKGTDEIRKFFSGSLYSNVELTWQPQFVDASASGDLGYTYGIYQFSALDPSGKKVYSEGIFHTVWKKQPDGTWRFVWD